MNFETSTTIQIEDYLRMIEYKTAVLIAGALQTGAIIGGSSKEDAQHLYEFGRNMGIAFQLQDDLLDTFGDEASFGKRIGGDIVQNKKTYLYLKALELANPAQKSFLIQQYTDQIEDEETKIAAVKEVFKALSIDTIADTIKNEYHEKAIKHLEEVQVKSDKKNHLRRLAETMLERII